MSTILSALTPTSTDLVARLRVLGACSAVALSNAMQVLDVSRQERLLPSKLLRGSSGVFVYFSSDHRYAEIECDDDGDIGIVMSDRSGNPALWFSQSTRLRSDLARIRAFLF